MCINVDDIITSECIDSLDVQYDLNYDELKRTAKEWNNANGERKNNHKSLRYTDTVNNIVMAQNGDGFNEKFENLVIKYQFSLNSRQKKLKLLNKEIDVKEEQLIKLNDEVKRNKIIADKYREFVQYIKNPPKI